MAEIKAKKVILRNRDGEHLIPVIEDKMGLALFDTVLKDYVLTYKESKGLALQGTYVYKDAIAGSRYGYADFYNKCLEEREEAIANGGVQKVTLGGTSMSMYIHPNGHMYYDISMKATVDNWFNTFGTAWFYGVDIENERIFLPRTLWFEQMTNDKAQVGLSVDAGLPNITGSIDPYSDINRNPTGAFSANKTAPTNPVGTNGTGNGSHLMFDASKSNSIYGKSDTVQPKAVKKLLYICVGNTVSDTSWVDVVTQVERGVKDLEDKKNTSIAEIDANAKSYDNLNKRQITNCLLEVPQNIKLELDNGTLTLKAGSKVIVPNGVNVFDEVAVVKDYSISGIANNSQVMFYYRADVGGLDYMALSHNYSGNTAPTFTGNYAKWYDTANNIMKATSDGGATWTANYSLPLCVFSTDNNGSIISIDQVFNGMGYIGSTVWVDKGVKGLIPNGRNEDGTLKNIEYTTEERVYTETTSRSENAVITIAIDNNGRINAYVNYFSQEENPNTPYTCWYKPSENNFYASDGQSNFSLARIVPILFYKSSNLQITNVIPYNTVDLLKRSNKSEISGWGMPSSKYINLTLGASGTTYTAPANGWFYAYAVATAQYSYLAWERQDTKMQMHIPSASNNYGCGIYMPVRKNDEVNLYYGDKRFEFLRFIYAEGEV